MNVFFFKQPTETTVGDFEKKLLTTLDDLGVIRQAVISNAAPESYEKFFKCFELFTEAHKLMTRKQLLTDMEIQILLF